MPNLGEGAESGTVVSILVKEGDEIEKGQTIVELENEKAVAPIPSPAAGTVGKLRVKEGDKLSVGQTILTLEGGKKKADEGKKKQAEETEAAEGQEEQEDEEEETGADTEAEDGEQKDQEEGEQEEEEEAGKDVVAPAAAPSVRKIARELGIDLRRIRGSERGGRIVPGDLRAYVQRLQKLAGQKPGKAAPAAAPAPKQIDFSKWGEILKKPMSPLRQTISRRMAENWNAIPHVTQFDEADITALDELRRKHAGAYEQKGTKLTLTAFALKAAVSALKKHGIFNSSLDEAAREIILKQYYHVGLAVDTEQGLIVPVIRDVDRKSLLELSQAVMELAEKARDRKVSSEDMRGGTFTISNQGGIGGGHFTPIVNRPEAAILGLGRGAWKAVVRDKNVQPRLMLPIAVSYDHRIIDGGSAARFVVDLVEAFQSFNEEEVALQSG